MSRSIIKSRGRLASRRAGSAWRIGLIGVSVVWGAMLWIDAQESALRDTNITTGVALLGAVVFLAAFHWRKKFSTIGWGTSKTWMQLHLIVGWISIGGFLIHTGFQWPTGGLDTLLYFLFFMTAASGVFGLYLTRAIPGRLRALQSEVIFEQIPSHRTEIAASARTLVLDSASTTDVIAQWYRSNLGMFFEGPRSPFYFVRPSGRVRRTHLQIGEGLDRYLTPEEMIQRRQLSTLVVRKDDLDYQFALQLRLKLWLFLHIGLTYGLLMVAFYHGLTALAFQGSV